MLSYGRSDGRVTHGVYNGIDYFYGGTAICYKDLWTKSTSYTYNNDCQLPKSFTHLPFLPNVEDNSVEDTVGLFNFTLNTGKNYFLLKRGL